MGRREEEETSERERGRKSEELGTEKDLLVSPSQKEWMSSGQTAENSILAVPCLVILLL